MVLAILFGLFWGTVVAYVMGRKGRLLLGFLLGFVLGPVGFLVSLFLRDSRTLCPHCRSPLLAADAAVCARCGREAAPRPHPAAFRLAADPGDAELQAAADRRAARA